MDLVEEPVPGPGELVLDVEYAGVNPLDVWVTQGTVAGGRQSLPFVPGTEAVARADGRRYVAQGGGYGTVRDGFYRERAVFPEEALVAVPEGVRAESAAALGVAGVTAWRLVDDVAAVTPADRVLVLGASGGVGCLLVQLARARGATVWGQTGNPAKTEAIEGFGAQRAVVAGAEDLRQAAAELAPTVAFDSLAGPFTRVLVELLEPHGRLALFGASAGPEVTLAGALMYRKGVNLLTYGGMVEPPERTRRALEQVLAELASGRLRVPIDEILPLEAAAEAHRRILERQVTGKLLLKP